MLGFRVQGLGFTFRVQVPKFLDLSVLFGIFQPIIWVLGPSRFGIVASELNMC